MPLLLETIKIEANEVCNLPYHQRRFDRSREALFNITESIDLSSRIKAPSSALYRCRLLYDSEIRSVEYIPYLPKEIHRLKIVTSTLSYTYKYANRNEINTLLEKHADYDEIIIEKEGFLTDTSIANLAFYDGKQWFTPQKPLLEGTMRAKLLEDGFLHRKQIQREDLKDYTHVALMNAMIGFKILKNFSIN